MKQNERAILVGHSSTKELWLEYIRSGSGQKSCSKQKAKLNIWTIWMPTKLWLNEERGEGQVTNVRAQFQITRRNYERKCSQNVIEVIANRINPYFFTIGTLNRSRNLQAWKRIC